MSRLNWPQGLPLAPHGGSISIDAAEASRSLGKILVDGAAAWFTGSPTAAVGSIKSLIDLSKGMEFKDDPQANGWHLFLLSIGWTLDTLRIDHDVPTDQARAALESVVETCKDAVVNQRHVMTADFFQRPYDNTLYKVAREAILSNLSAIRDDLGYNESELRRRLDSTFSRAVLEISLQRTDLYGSIAESLSVLSSSSANTIQEWEHYQSILSFDFRSSVLFGQESSRIGTGELYVGLRAQHRKKASESDPRTLSPPFFLNDHLRDWIDCRSDDDLRVIGGGPGSGKSTSLKELAAGLSENASNRVIYIGLQHITLSNDLRTEIDRFVSEKTNSFKRHTILSHESLEHVNCLTLLFDGLDEIARPGESADQIAQQFVIKLNQLLSGLRVREHSPQIKAIISGRIPAFQAVRKYLDISEEHCFELCGFLPNTEYDTDVGSLDQRRTWWTKYATIFNRDSEPPGAFLSDEWESLTEEPLLCYLLALSGYIDRAQDIGTLPNRNEIYERLIDQIWERGWGDEGNRKVRTGAILSKRDFNQLMETIAIAAWQGGDTRTATEDVFKDAIQSMRRTEVWDRFVATSGPDITNLAMNFYLKSPDELSRGFEFTHKSFGDYLAARCLLSFAFEVVSFGERRVDIALADWFRVAGLCRFSAEISTHLFDELQLIAEKEAKSLDHVRKLQAYFELMEIDVARKGFVAPSAPTKLLTQRASNAESAIMGIRCGCFLAAQKISSSATLFKLPADVLGGFRGIMDRLLEYRVGLDVPSFRAPPANFFCGLDAQESDFFGSHYHGVDLSYSNLSNSNFSWSSHYSWNLSHCNLEDCRFIRCNFMYTSFTGSNLRNCSFSSAKIDSTDLFTKTRGVIAMNADTFALMEPAVLSHLLRSKRRQKRIKRDERWSARRQFEHTKQGLAVFEQMFEGSE